MAQDRRAVKVRITGRVQGVYFRGWTREQAETLGLVGWVRNEYDGSVSALIAGPADAVEAMLRLIHRGPRDARVDKVEIEEADVVTAPKRFEITR